MSRAIFEALSGGKTILDAADSAADNTIVVPAATGILPVPTTVGLLNQVLTSSGTTTPTWQYLTGTGTVTSVNGSGGSTGLTLTGGPITVAGTLTLGGLLNATYGGTGASNLVGYMFGNGANPASASLTIPNTSISGLGTMSTQDANTVAITGGTGSFSTLNSSGNTRLGGLSGNQSLQINNVASAVNYAQIVGAVTTGAPVLSVQGTDTNIGLVLQSKGTGLVALGGSTVANSAAQFVTTTSGVNFLQFTGGATGVSPSFVSSGTDASVGFNISTKGNANVAFFTNNFGNFSFVVKNVASAVNYLISNGSATGNSPSFAVDGSDTNIGLALTPKGTGALQVTGTGFSPNVNLTDAATIAWDTTTAGGQTATFTFVSSNRTFGAPTNLKNGAFYALAVIQNAGSNTLTWNAVFKWTGGVAPTLSTAASARDYFVFRSDGTNLYEQGRSLGVA